MKNPVFLPYLAAGAAIAALAGLGAAPALAADASPESLDPGVLVAPVLTLDQAASQPASAPAQPAGPRLFPDPDAKGPPLPFHTIEGYGGGAITPIAYLVNNPGKDTAIGLPSVAFSYVNAGSKDLEALTISQTFFGRLELSYGADRFGVGGLRGALIKATQKDIGTDVWLHNFNARVALLDEGAFGQDWLPAVTAGVHFKYNPDIERINNQLGNALGSIGYRRNSGEDFTLTISKMFPKVFDRPLIVSAGVRASQASQLGILGFSDQWSATFEGNIVYLPTDWLVVAYEFRQKNDPYGRIPGLIGGEDNWHAFDVSWIINKHATLVAGYGIFGTLANGEANSSFWLQLKFEF